ncbi:hypothetical protein N7449_012403 [Penicillium cf. viridicatum]|uniref:Uncharacterized protein n=1 Tax=Penicillium cf. viridicatum TaxID=2972119 RepID=A0A9W9IRP4_9EURO|nr:hypothetical protein N7449_012403 [Penicillium cf. viridicatum]
MEIEPLESMITQPTTSVSDEVKAADWAEITDQAEHRRRQNPINQRAYSMLAPSPRSCCIRWIVVDRSSGRRQRMQGKQEILIPKNITHASFAASSSSSAPPGQLILPKGNAQPMDESYGCPNIDLYQDLLKQFTKAAYQSYMQESPTSDHLVTLTKFNVFRAFDHNMRLIGMVPSGFNDDTISLFNTLRSDQSPDAYKHIPPSLRPTPIQRQIPHHPWLDFFPIPKMRQNLLQAVEGWDDEELCHDIMGFWEPTSVTSGLLVWGEPWDVRNWEVTEVFLKKWPWVVRGCPDLITSTNAWRAKRGERLIFRYV